MKYIRTKDGRIIDFNSLTETAKASVSMDAMEKNCDFEIGDTIEELCDEFVCIRKDNSKALLSCVDEVLPLRMCYIGIYGAIWIDALLKPVAKMNDKGELELL